MGPNVRMFKISSTLSAPCYMYVSCFFLLISPYYIELSKIITSNMIKQIAPYSW